MVDPRREKEEHAFAWCRGNPSLAIVEEIHLNIHRFAVFFDKQAREAFSW